MLKLMNNLISKLVVVQTVTNFYSGKLESIEDGFMLISSAAWIADTGRATDFYANPKETAREVEVFSQNIYVALGSIVSAYEVSSVPASQRG